jgi:hypothetical protein
MKPQVFLAGLLAAPLAWELWQVIGPAWRARRDEARRRKSEVALVALLARRLDEMNGQRLEEKRHLRSLLRSHFEKPDTIEHQFAASFRRMARVGAHREELLALWMQTRAAAMRAAASRRSPPPGAADAGR